MYYMKYNNETLTGQFANKLRSLLTDTKKFKGITADFWRLDVDNSGFWEFSYKGQNFLIEWWLERNNKYICVNCRCETVETIDGNLDVSNCCYDIDAEVSLNSEDHGVLSIDDFMYELEDMILSCDIAKRVNTIYKKVEKLKNDIDNLNGNGNNDILIDILKQFDLIN